MKTLCEAVEHKYFVLCFNLIKREDYISDVDIRCDI